MVWKRKNVQLIILSAILYGTMTPGGHIFTERGLNSLDIAFFRSFFVSLTLLPLILIRKQLLPQKKTMTLFITYGFVGATLELLAFGSIGLGVPIALVALLLYSQPIWTILLGKILLKETITKRKLLSAITGMMGIAVLVKSWEITDAKSILGILLALGSGIALSFWVILGKKSMNLKNHYVTTAFSWSFFSVIWLLLFYLIWIKLLPANDSFLFTYDLIPNNLFYLYIFALISGLIPHLLFYKGVITISGGIAGIILLLEPLTAIIIADILFSQKVGIELALGGTLILISNYFVIKSD